MMKVTFAGNVFVHGSEKLTRHVLPETVTPDVLGMAIAQAIEAGTLRVIPRDDSGYTYETPTGEEKTPGRFAGKEVALADGTKARTAGKTGWNLSGSLVLPG